MSDARLRNRERDLAAHPSPEARDRLAAERARRGDGPWLPVLAAQEDAWRDEKVVRTARPWVDVWSFLSKSARRAIRRGAWAPVEGTWDVDTSGPRPMVRRLVARPVESRGVSAFHAIRDELTAIDEAQRAAGLAFPWIDPLSEARAAALDIELRHGVRTLAEVAAEQGLDWRQLLDAELGRGTDGF